MIYVFQGGTELVEIKVEHIKDLGIRANNAMIKTGDEFVPMSNLLGEEKTKELQDKLEKLFENYFIMEFSKMGYSLIKKND